MSTLLGWHFSAADKRLRYGDGRLIRTGRTLKVTGKPELCLHGLHACARLIDALEYAPGPYLWRVKLSGVIVRGRNIAAATERTALWGFDASKMLRGFACKCALDVVHLWDAPDVVVRYLKTGDETIRDAAQDAALAAARDAAQAAAWAAAWAAARDAALAAARGAVWATARGAAWAAARDAVWATARGAAWAAARDAQNRALLRMVRAWRSK